MVSIIVTGGSCPVTGMNNKSSPCKYTTLPIFFTETDLILYLGKSFPNSVQFLFLQNSLRVCHVLYAGCFYQHWLELYNIF